MESGNNSQRRAAVNQQLSPPDPSPGGRETGGKRIALGILILFVILLSGAAVVLFFLPSPVPESPAVFPGQTAEHSDLRAEPDTLPPDKSEETERLEKAVASARDDAENHREEFLSLKVTADSQNIAQWGGASYQAINDMFTRADELFNQQDYALALERYQQGAHDLQALLDSRLQRLKDAVAAGQRALLDKQPAQARELFEYALAIDPSDKEAQDGILQSEKLASILSFYNNALSLEAAGRLKESIGELENALILDNSYEPALKARVRIQARIDERTFQEEMNALMAAIEQQDFSLAQKSLQALQSLKINQEQVEQAEQLLAERKLRAFIKKSRETAESYKQKEQWKQALDTYDKILSSTPDALFAVAGKEEAYKRVKLDSALSDAIGSPHRLEDDAQAAMAAQLLAYAKQINPPGVRLQSQIASLDALLMQASTPVLVTLESDNQTSIVIYHVGRIGSFFSKEITLKPGTYTVVGSKTGYRDVRKTLTLEANGNDYRFVIICEEPI